MGNISNISNISKLTNINNSFNNSSYENNENLSIDTMFLNKCSTNIFYWLYSKKNDKKSYEWYFMNDNLALTLEMCFQKSSNKIIEYKNWIFDLDKMIQININNNKQRFLIRSCYNELCNLKNQYLSFINDPNYIQYCCKIDDKYYLYQPYIIKILNSANYNTDNNIFYINGQIYKISLIDMIQININTNVIRNIYKYNDIYINNIIYAFNF